MTECANCLNSLLGMRAESSARPGVCIFCEVALAKPSCSSTPVPDLNLSLARTLDRVWSIRCSA